MSKYICLVFCLLINISSWAIELADSEMVERDCLSNLPVELIEYIVSSFQPHEYLKTLATFSSLNRYFSVVFSHENIIDFFYLCFKDNLSSTTFPKIKDNILHCLSRNGQYKQLLFLLKRLASSKNYDHKVFVANNYLLESPFLTFLVCKKEDISGEQQEHFDQAFNLLNTLSPLPRYHHSHTHLITCARIMNKLNDTQQNILKQRFETRPIYQQEAILSKSFIYAMFGNVEKLKKQTESYIYCDIEFSSELNLEKCGMYNETPLHVAAYNGHVEALRFLLSQPAADDLLNSDSYEHKTPLIRAAEGGFNECIKLFANKNVLIRLTDCEGKTAIEYAIANGNLTAVEMLLKSRLLHMDIKSWQDLGQYADGQEMSRLLFKKMIEAQDGNPVMNAALFNLPDKIYQLHEEGHNIETAYNNGSTAIMFAAQNGHIESVQALIDLGADIWRQNHNQNDAIYYACYNQSKLSRQKAYQICHALLSHWVTIRNNGIYVDEEQITQAYKLMMHKGFTDLAALLKDGMQN